MRTTKYIVLLSVLFFSCKKTKLEGELSPLVGSWEWTYTVKTSDLCEPFYYDSLVTNSPSNAGFTYSLLFERKGKISIYKNGSLEEKYRLVYKTKNIQPNFVIYYFRLNNRKKMVVGFTIYNNRPKLLYTTYFPEGIVNEDGCQSIENVFEKQINN